MSFLILPTRDLAEELNHLLQGWCQRQNFVHEQFVTHNNCLTVVRALVNDIVDNRMRWIRVKNDNLRAESFNLFPFVTTDEIFNALYVDIYERLETRIYEMMEGYIPHRTWRVFYLNKIGQDFSVERGEDYRVMDWQRRYEAGEISLNEG